MSRISRRRIVAVGAAVAALASASAYGGWTAGRSDLDRLSILERRVRALESAAATVSGERDRLKADRDRLEAQLAAIDATPAACPQATVSTLDVSLWVKFIVEYPCGWHVFEQPMEAPQENSPRFGLIVDHLFLHPFPISMQPTEHPPASILLDGWYDDPSFGGSLPAFKDWVAEARGRFTTVTEKGFKTRSGIGVLRLEGEIDAYDHPRPGLLYLWEHTDTDGVRRIYEAFALEPGAGVTKAIDAMVRSFRFPGG